MRRSEDTYEAFDRRGGFVGCVFLAGCGGGIESARTHAMFAIEGRVLNGVLAGSIIQVLGAGDGIALGTATPDSEGRYRVEVLQEGPYRVRATGGELYGVDYSGTLEAFCPIGSDCFVTPYTTVLLRLVDAHGSNHGDAKALMADKLGFDVDPFTEEVSVEDFDVIVPRVAIAGGNDLAGWVASVVVWATEEGAAPPLGISDNQHIVSASAGTGGSIDPAQRNVSHGAETSFMVTPDTGYSIATVSGCDGSLDGSIHSTASIVQSCTVTASLCNEDEDALGPTAVGSCGPTPQDLQYSNTLSTTNIDSSSYPIFTFDNGSVDPIVTPNGGEVTITDTTTGEFVYTPGAVRGRDPFRFMVTDTAGNTSTATETVIVDQPVMPLGDSITSGYISKSDNPHDSFRVGYREKLQNMLRGFGVTLDFVGTVEHGWKALGFDSNHQGKDSWFAADVTWGCTVLQHDSVRTWLDQNTPDFILLHVGTNELDPSNYIDVSAIPDEIELWQLNAPTEDVEVIVALVIDRYPNDSRVTLFNDNVQILVEKRIAEGAMLRPRRPTRRFGLPPRLGWSIPS